jgi:hypothetical protein
MERTIRSQVDMTVDIVGLRIEPGRIGMVSLLRDRLCETSFYKIAITFLALFTDLSAL